MRAYHSSSLPVATLATIRKVVVENQWEMKIKANRQLVYMALAQQYKCVCLCVCVWGGAETFEPGVWWWIFWMIEISCDHVCNVTAVSVTGGLTELWGRSSGHAENCRTDRFLFWDKWTIAAAIRPFCDSPVSNLPILILQLASRNCPNQYSH